MAPSLASAALPAERERGDESDVPLTLRTLRHKADGKITQKKTINCNKNHIDNKFTMCDNSKRSARRAGVNENTYCGGITYEGNNLYR